MLDLEVQPERSIGNEQWEFVLGMPLYKIIHIIKKQDTYIKGVQLWYNDQNPLDSDLIVHLSQDGIRLLFDSVTQRLKTIEVYSLAKVKLKYCGTYFNSPDIPPTINQIDQSFGATHPGIYLREKQLYVLNFRGISFEFKVESTFEPDYSHGLGSIRISGDSTPTVSHLLIYVGPKYDKSCVPLMPLERLQNGIYLERLEVVRNNSRTEAFEFHLVHANNDSPRMRNVSNRSFTRVVKFGDTCQDVVSALGCPNSIYYKDQDKMRIHSPKDPKLLRSSRSSYFFNYFTLGVDLLFDANSGQLRKVVLHTNYPGHYNFNIYYRCNFHIPLPKSQGKEVGQSGDSLETVDVVMDTKWQSIQSSVLTPGTKPVVLKHPGTTNTVNPFGPTFCYGVEDMIFEVMQNQHIASVTLYRQKFSSTIDVTQH